MNVNMEMQIFSFMEAEGLRTIYVDYSGSDDEGSFHDVSADDSKKLPHQVSQIVRESARGAVERCHSGWEDNEGGGGTVEYRLFDQEIRGPRIVIDHHENVTDQVLNTSTVWPELPDETTITVSEKEYTFKRFDCSNQSVTSTDILATMTALGIVSVDVLYNMDRADLSFETVRILMDGCDKPILDSFYAVPAHHHLDAAIYPVGTYLNDIFRLAIWQSITKACGERWWNTHPKDNGQASFVITDGKLAGHIRHDCYEYRKVSEQNMFLDATAV